MHFRIILVIKDQNYFGSSSWDTKGTRIVIVDCPELPEIAHVCKVCRPSTYAELPFAILTEMTKISKILPFVYTKSSQIVVKIRRLTTRIVLIHSKAIMCKMPWRHLHRLWEIVASVRPLSFCFQATEIVATLSL